MGLIAIDTEGSVKRPWSVQICRKAGEASVVLAKDVKPTTIPYAILHHSLHDLAVLSAMGITVAKFEDTMLKAALLGCEPHGLKDLARRHLGMRMQTYDGLMAGARREKYINYLGEIVEWINGNCNLQESTRNG